MDLRLRPYQLSDQSALAALANNPQVSANLKDILHDVEQKALVSLDGAVDYSLQDKVVNGKLYYSKQ